MVTRPWPGGNATAYGLQGRVHIVASDSCVPRLVATRTRTSARRIARKMTSSWSWRWTMASADTKASAGSWSPVARESTGTTHEVRVGTGPGGGGTEVLVSEAVVVTLVVPAETEVLLDWVDVLVGQSSGTSHTGPVVTLEV